MNFAVKTCSSVVSVFPLGFSTIFIAEFYENWYQEISFLCLTGVVTDFALHCVHRTVAHSILMLLGRAQTSIDILFCSPGTYRRCLASTCPSLLTDKLHWKTEHCGKKWPKKSQLGKGSHFFDDTFTHCVKTIWIKSHFCELCKRITYARNEKNIDFINC